MSSARYSELSQELMPLNQIVIHKPKAKTSSSIESKRLIYLKERNNYLTESIVLIRRAMRRRTSPISVLMSLIMFGTAAYLIVDSRFFRNFCRELEDQYPDWLARQFSLVNNDLKISINGLKVLTDFNNTVTNQIQSYQRDEMNLQKEIITLKNQTYSFLANIATLATLNVSNPFPILYSFYSQINYKWYCYSAPLWNKPNYWVIKSCKDRMQGICGDNGINYYNCNPFYPSDWPFGKPINLDDPCSPMIKSFCQSDYNQLNYLLKNSFNNQIIDIQSQIRRKNIEQHDASQSISNTQKTKVVILNKISRMKLDIKEQNYTVSNFYNNPPEYHPDFNYYYDWIGGAFYFYLLTLGLGEVAPLFVILIATMTSLFTRCMYRACLGMNSLDREHINSIAKVYDIFEEGLDANSRTLTLFENLLDENIKEIHDETQHLKMDEKRRDAFLDADADTIVDEKKAPISMLFNHPQLREPKLSSFIFEFSGIDIDARSNEIAKKARHTFELGGHQKNLQSPNAQNVAIKPVFRFFDRLKNERWVRVEKHDAKGHLIKDVQFPYHYYALQKYLNNELAHNPKEVLKTIYQFTGK